MSEGLKAPNFSRRTPKGDVRERDVCRICGFINYENPKVVAGSVVISDDKVLMCRRSIEPRRGRWTLPAGFMEINETVEEAARREAAEEACADIELECVLGVYSIPRISQIQVIYRAGLKTPEFSAGDETLEVALFAWDDIPWSRIAFPSVHWALNHARAVRGQAVFAPFSNPAGETGDMEPR